MIQWKRDSFAVAYQPVTQRRITIAKRERDSFLHILLDSIKGRKRKITLMIDNFGQQLSTDKIQPINGLHQCVRQIKFRWMNIPMWMCQRGKRDQRMRGRLVAQGARWTV